MMRERTGTRWLALAALLAVVATACGGTEERSSAPPQTPPEVGFPPWATAPAVRANRPAVDNIAFESAGDLWLVHADGTGRKRLTEGTSAGPPSWSPDGTRIAFSSNDFYTTNSNGISTMNADGTGLTRLTEDKDFCPTWSPDGTRIAFSRVADDWNRWEIHVMDADGTDLKRLATGDWEVCPAWSPDGARIAFPRRARVHVMNADGTELRAVNPEFAVLSSNVQWSPGGTEVIFHNPSWQHGLYAMNMNSGETRLLVPWKAVWGTNFSPDGTRIAFFRRRHMFVVNADGSGLTRLLPRHPSRGWSPSWSPDGTRIAFVSDRHRMSGEQIFVMNADGSGVTQLTFPLPEGPYRFSPAGAPVWSPVSATSSDHKGDGDAS